MTRIWKLSAIYVYYPGTLFIQWFVYLFAQQIDAANTLLPIDAAAAHDKYLSAVHFTRRRFTR